MSKQVTSRVPEHFRENACPAHDAGWNPVSRPKQCKNAVSVGLLATVIMLSTNCASRAANDCIAEPTRPPAQGGHWYYRFDRASNRKCWYLVEPGAPMPTAQAPELQPSPDPSPQPTFGAFFSSLSASITGSTTVAQPDNTQPAHPDDLRNGGGEPRRQPRMVLASKQHRPAHLRPPAEHADERPAASLKPVERDALFQEFLRWKDRQ